ncbi:hypothetical protein AUJ42_02885 [Candidatus Collierbacteria bacterium CG1_02_44_10]|uniref:Uncharacterized protein n=1 Tax=Candidatus Collierbacteria bacterium CG1_02_44_10 TaxID=1805087 RepID=A0A1J4RW20_9BACT|nr:MAG: hypothetical protein AUJ42_02885 [Candidatus Collierbacteria bacterium CG1_02_44_10]
MVFYMIAFMFFQTLFYLFVGSFIIFILRMIFGLIKATDQTLVYRACLWLIVLSPVCGFMANVIMRKIKLQRLKGE